MEEMKTTPTQLDFTIHNIVNENGQITKEQNLIATNEGEQTEFELIRAEKENIFYMRMGEISLILEIDEEALMEEACYYSVQRHDYQQYHDIIFCFHADKTEIKVYRDHQQVEDIAPQKSLNYCPLLTH